MYTVKPLTGGKLRFSIFALMRLLPMFFFLVALVNAVDNFCSEAEPKSAKGTNHV
jgi:hypothetical protein